MAISISPTDLIRLFRDRGIRDKESVAAYLNDIASTATRLAELWTLLYSEVCERPFPQTASHAHDAVDDDRTGWHETLGAQLHQVGVYHQMEAYFNGSSAVLDGRLREEQQEELFNALGGLLRTRDKTKKLYDLAKENDWDLLYTPPEEWRNPVTEDQLRDLVEALHKEAATLRALVSKVRASR